MFTRSIRWIAIRIKERYQNVIDDSQSDDVINDMFMENIESIIIPLHLRQRFEPHSNRPIPIERRENNGGYNKKANINKKKTRKKNKKKNKNKKKKSKKRKKTMKKSKRKK